MSNEQCEEKTAALAAGRRGRRRISHRGHGVKKNIEASAISAYSAVDLLHLQLGVLASLREVFGECAFA
jgi:predicted dinucleotide-utilizing enzyme